MIKKYKYNMNSKIIKLKKNWLNAQRNWCVCLWAENAFYSGSILEYKDKEKLFSVGIRGSFLIKIKASIIS